VALKDSAAAKAILARELIAEPAEQKMTPLEYPFAGPTIETNDHLA
jgi:hypothetical protein